MKRHMWRKVNPTGQALSALYCPHSGDALGYFDQRDTAATKALTCLSHRPIRFVNWNQPSRLSSDRFGMVGATGLALSARTMRDSGDTLARLSEW